MRPSWWAAAAIAVWAGLIFLWSSALSTAGALSEAVYETIMASFYALIVLAWALGHQERRLRHLAKFGSAVPQPDERRLALAVALAVALMAAATLWLTSAIIRPEARFPKAEWDIAALGAWIGAGVFTGFYRRYPAALRPNFFVLWTILFCTSFAASVFRLLFDPARFATARRALALAMQEWAHVLDLSAQMLGT